MPKLSVAFCTQLRTLNPTVMGEVILRRSAISHHLNDKTCLDVTILFVYSLSVIATPGESLGE